MKPEGKCEVKLNCVCTTQPDWQLVLDLACHYKDVGNSPWASGLLWLRREKVWPSAWEESPENPGSGWFFIYTGGYSWASKYSHWIPNEFYYVPGISDTGIPHRCGSRDIRSLMEKFLNAFVVNPDLFNSRCG